MSDISPMNWFIWNCTVILSNMNIVQRIWATDSCIGENVLLSWRMLAGRGQEGITSFGICFFLSKYFDFFITYIMSRPCQVSWKIKVKVEKKNKKQNMLCVCIRKKYNSNYDHIMWVNFFCWSRNGRQG